MDATRRGKRHSGVERAARIVSRGFDAFYCRCVASFTAMTVDMMDLDGGRDMTQTVLRVFCESFCDTGISWRAKP